MEVLISKALIDSKISQDEFVLINNVQKEYRDIKEEIKNLKYLSIFLKQCYRIFWREEKIQKEKTQLSYFVKRRKNTERKNPNAGKTKKGRIILLSKYIVCDIKNSDFIKEQEAHVL